LEEDNVKALMIYAFLRGVGVGCFRTLFPLYLVDLGYKLEDVGLISTLALIPNVLILPIIGFLTDYVGRRPMIILTGIFTALSLLIPSLTTLYPLLLLSSALLSFSVFSGQPSRSALIADSVDVKRLGEAFAKVTLMFTMASAITPFIAGIAVEPLGYPMVFQLCGLLSFLGILYFVVRSKEVKRGRVTRGLKVEFIDTFKVEKSIIWLYAFVSIDRFAWNLWFPLMNAYFRDYLRMNPSIVGLYNSLIYSIVTITGYASGRIIDIIGYLGGLLTSEIIGSASAAMLGLAPNNTTLILGLMGIGLSLSLWIPSYNIAIALNSNPKVRGRIYSKMNALRIGFSTPAPWIGGFIMEYIWIAGAFIASSILMLMNLSLIVWKLKVKAKHEV